MPAFIHRNRTKIKFLVQNYAKIIFQFCRNYSCAHIGLIQLKKLFKYLILAFFEAIIILEQEMEVEFFKTNRFSCFSRAYGSYPCSADAPYLAIHVPAYAGG